MILSSQFSIYMWKNVEEIVSFKLQRYDFVSKKLAHAKVGLKGKIIKISWEIFEIGQVQILWIVFNIQAAGCRLCAVAATFLHTFGAKKRHGSRAF